MGVCGPLTAPIAHFIEQCLTEGMEPAVIVDAIERTGWARRPSPFYLRAILQRYRREQIRTMEDVGFDDAERRQFQQQHGDDGWREWFQCD
ncbi:MAG: DnaD domain protein [Clostridia bacterium]|nr:DnaD domain protein [Clostridia bacterium]